MASSSIGVAHVLSSSVAFAKTTSDGEWISTIIDDKLYLLKPDYDDCTWDRNKWHALNRDIGEAKYPQYK